MHSDKHKFHVVRVFKTLDVRNVKCYNDFIEDENLRALHMYQALGFNELILRKQEEYQGDVYEYNLYLMR